MRWDGLLGAGWMAEERVQDWRARSGRIENGGDDGTMWMDSRSLAFCV